MKRSRYNIIEINDTYQRIHVVESLIFKHRPISLCQTRKVRVPAREIYHRGNLHLYNPSCLHIHPPGDLGQIQGMEYIPQGIRGFQEGISSVLSMYTTLITPRRPIVLDPGHFQGMEDTPSEVVTAVFKYTE
ncbi:hypothetical protein J6590_082929 [Homalodisca vitripennis]|nr:hypothetical protein J6590_082929 [Homalodisca vitripennis]